MDAHTDTTHWAYTRYMNAFQALAKAEGRTDLTDDVLQKLEAHLDKQDTNTLSAAVASMNKRRGWIDDIAQRTQQWHEVHAGASSEFSKREKVEGRQVLSYDEQKHRRFLAKCNNLSLEHGVHVVPHTEQKHAAYARFTSEDYRDWKAQCRMLSPTRHEDEIRSTDVIPTPERMTTHPKTWRSVAEAIKAYREDPPPWQRGR